MICGEDRPKGSTNLHCLDRMTRWNTADFFNQCFQGCSKLNFCITAMTDSTGQRNQRCTPALCCSHPGKPFSAMIQYGRNTAPCLDITDNRWLSPQTGNSWVRRFLSRFTNKSLNRMNQIHFFAGYICACSQLNNNLKMKAAV